jgi:hypothetical protein
MVRNQIILADKIFKTKKASYLYLKEKIYNLGECEIDSSHVDFEFFKSITKFKAITVSKFILYKKGVSLQLKAIVEDTELILSWKDCSKQNSTVCYAEQLDQALRNCIEIKTTHAECFQCCEDTTLYSDHIYPFYKIKSEFLHNVSIPLVNENNVYVFSNVFKDEWLAYHNEKATYRYLCIKCKKNVSKKMKHIEHVIEYNKTKVASDESKLKKKLERYKMKVIALELEISG